MAGTAVRTGQMLKGKYRLEALLGSGGMGDVYRASNVLVDRTVAIKALHPRHSKNEEIVGRFMREARAANAVRHRHIVDVLDIDRDDSGVPFIVQEYLEGEDLAARMKRPPYRLTPDETLGILLPVIEAVGVAHRKGVVHRDLKPDNIFLARIEGEVVPKILDFGISKIDVEENIRLHNTAGDNGEPEQASSSRLTAAGAAMGTPAYMSPEQIRDPRSVDARSDVWSIGVLLYEVMSSKMPFDAEDLAGLFAVIQTVDPPQLDRVAPAVPKALARIVHRCLQPDPLVRYRDAVELAAALRGYRERAEKAQSDSREPSSSLLPGDVAALKPGSGSAPPLAESPTQKEKQSPPPNWELELDVPAPERADAAASMPAPRSSSPHKQAPAAHEPGSLLDDMDDDPLESPLDIDLDQAKPNPDWSIPARRPVQGAPPVGARHRAALTAERDEHGEDRGISVRRRIPLPGASVWPALRSFLGCSATVAGVAAGARYLSPDGIAEVRGMWGPMAWQLYTGATAVSLVALVCVAAAGMRRVSYALFLAALGLTVATAAALSATSVLAAPGIFPSTFRKLALVAAPWAALATIVGLGLFALARGRALRREEGAPIFGWLLTLASLGCIAAVGWLAVTAPRTGIGDVANMSLVPAEARARRELARFAVVTAGARALERPTAPPAHSAPTPPK